MSEVKLHLRYPDSKPEDITDAYMRGVEVGRTLGTGSCNCSNNCTNSERTDGTCRDLGGTGANGEQVFNCSKCGCVLSLYDRDGINNLCTSFVFDYPRYCPECGRKVVTNG